MKKEHELLVYPILMVISFFFLLPFSVKYGWFDFLEDNEFDPEKDTCIANYGKCSLALIDSGELYCKDDCRDWRPKNECEKGNPEYIEELKCTEFFQQKEINLTIYGYNLTIDLATANEEMYACGKYKKVCTIKMKAPNQSFNAAKMEITWGDNTHSVYKDGVYVGEIKEGDDTSWVR